MTRVVMAATAPSRVRGWSWPLVVLAALLALGCGPSPQRTGDSSPADARAAVSTRTLSMGIHYEPTDLAPKIPGSSSPIIVKRLFNATLAAMDGDQTPRPALAESLPQLNTDSWRVFPDGRMETTYR